MMWEMPFKAEGREISFNVMVGHSPAYEKAQKKTKNAPMETTACKNVSLLHACSIQCVLV